MSCIHIYHRGVSTTEHFGNISWRQSAGVIVKHGFKWMGKIFYLWFVCPRICSMCLHIFLILLDFWYKLYILYIEFRWILKSCIFPVAHLTGEQAASECEKSNTNNTVFYLKIATILSAEHFGIYLYKICFKIIIRKLLRIILLSIKQICCQNCSVKAGDVAILYFSTVIPTYLKVLYFQNYF